MEKTASEKVIKKTVKKKSKKQNKTVSKKRYMKPRKCYLADEEVEMLLSKMSGPVSLSNCLRHHLGLVMNTPGRKKKNPPAAIDLDFLDD